MVNEIKVKFLALLHEPPWRPWLKGIEERRIVKDVLTKMGLGSAYEDLGELGKSEGYALAKVIGKADVAKLERTVNVARLFSTSADEFLTPQAEVQVPRYKLNMFNPLYKYDIQEPRDVPGFVEDALNLYLGIENDVIRYNALYTSLELLWYSHNPKGIPVADPRSPTYSLFDLLYSTATLSNWFLDGDEPKGYLVKVDIPGIQQVISKARRASDLWAGSWTLSFLAYRTVEPLIFKYGADIMISPFIGLNPFLISSVIKKMEEGVPKDVAKKYRNLFSSEILTPYQPVMPATILLALPPVYEKADDVKREITENYSNAWKTLVDKCINSDVRERIRDFPIMPIKVEVIDVNNAFKDFREAVGSFTSGSSDLVEPSNSLFLEWLIKEVNKESPVKVLYGVTYALEAGKNTHALFKEGGKYALCTSCGILPSVVHGGEDKNLDEREELCAYCYIKRVLGKSNKRKLLEELGFYVEEDFEVIPSTIDIANLSLWREVLSKVGIKDNVKIPLPKPLKEYEDVGYLFYIGEERPFISILREPKKAKELFSNVNDDDFLRELPKKIKIYYAIVRGDGDFIGKKVWRGGIEMTLKVYIEKTRGSVTEEIERRLNSLLSLMKHLSLGPDDFIKGERSAVIPVTGIYLIAISRALALSAVKDASTVSKKGFLVFAGGDDVMFLTPVEEALDLVKETRTNYWGSPVGFHVFNEMVVDALSLYGRSYGVLIAHYKDAVYNLWEIAHSLEETKDFLEIKINSETRSPKDVTVVLRGRGAIEWEEAAILYNYPLVEGGKLSLRVLDVLDSLRREKKLTSSFIQDWLTTDVTVIREFPEDAIAHLFRRNGDPHLKLRGLYQDLVSLDLTITMKGEKWDQRKDASRDMDFSNSSPKKEDQRTEVINHHPVNRNKRQMERDQRTEVIKAIKQLEV
ncbi:type III-B CRISPR-associated protein Cas10/Cmr2 [Sulfolobales archaeon HS-7]|nr:type III-B CRISPR-associated protein Cas10/Cmr2 [Sulfolobales archaeon HS-7]